MSIQALDLSGAAGVAAPWGGGGASTARLSSFRVVWVLRVALAGMVVAQLGRIPFLAAGDKDAPVLVNDLLIMLVVGAGVLASLRSRRLLLDSVGALALTFALVGGTSAVLAIPRFGLSVTEFIFSIAYLFRWLAYFGVYLVALNFIQRPQIAGVWRTLEMAVLAFSAFGIFQSIFLPGFAQIVYPDAALYMDWDPQGHRLVSSFLDPNFAGALIVMVLLIYLGRLAYSEPVERWKLLMLLVALALTLSRGAVIGFIAGLMMIFYVRGLARGLIRFVAIGTALVLPLLPFLVAYAVTYNKLEFDGSAMTRVVGWLNGIEVFARHPIIGVGFNTYGFVQAEYFGGGLYRASFGLDGGLLFVAVLTGTVGVIVYGMMIAAVFRRCRRIWRESGRPKEERALALGVAAATTGVVVHSFFLNTLFYPFLMEPFWVLWAMTAVVARTAPTEGEPSPAVGSRPAGLQLVARAGSS